MTQANLIAIARNATADKHLIFVSGDTYTNGVLWHGEAGDLKRVPITGPVKMYRDGGTIVIDTADGQVTFPRRMSSKDNYAPGRMTYLGEPYTQGRVRQGEYRAVIELDENGMPRPEGGISLVRAVPTR